MNRFLKLVNFEFNRVAIIFFTLLAIMLVFQIAGVIVMSNSYLSEANYALNEKLLTKAEFLGKAGPGPMNMVEVVRSLWFMAPIGLCAGAVVFYIFLIWYRDWFGKNTFIYRLLMLPTARLNVFLAKITTILLMTFGFVAFQLILLPVESMVLKWLVPSDYRIAMGIREIIGSFGPLQMVIPDNIVKLLLFYGAGATAVVVLFTAILFERSYRLKGILMGMGYCILAIVVFVLPALLQLFVIPDFFYPIELFVLMVFAGLVVLSGSIWMSGMLLKKKITV